MRRWLSVRRVMSVSNGAALRRAQAKRATDVPVLLRQMQCVSVHHGDVGTRRRSSAVIDVEPRLLIDRQTRLSRLSAAWELSVPRLSHDRH
jgi:hypothetical protein